MKLYTVIYVLWSKCGHKPGNFNLVSCQVFISYLTLWHCHNSKKTLTIKIPLENNFRNDIKGSLLHLFSQNIQLFDFFNNKDRESSIFRKKHAEAYLQDAPSAFQGALNDFAVTTEDELWEEVYLLALKERQVSLEQIEKIVFIEKGSQKLNIQSINLLHDLYHKNVDMMRQLDLSNYFFKKTGFHMSGVNEYKLCTY